MAGFPAADEVEKADREQLAKWYRFLPAGETPAELKLTERINERFQKLGGMSPALSKKIGV